MSSTGGAYSPGISSGSSSTTGCSGGCFNQNGVKYQYLQGYMSAHMLPIPSYRYVYIMWFGTVVVSLVLGASHMLGVGDRSYIGAKWKQFATRNRTYKVGKRVDIHGNHIAKDSHGFNRDSAPAKPRRIFSFPSFGRLALLFCMFAIPIILTLVGADYIGPNVSVFDLSQSWPPQTTNTVGFSRRALQTLAKRFRWGQGPYPNVTTYPPSRTLPYRTWWTIGDRLGNITMAMTPIVLFMAMKQVPFALFSTRFFGGYAFDRLSFLHKWGGRIIWIFATAHLVTWTVQLNLDHRAGASDIVWSFVFMWIRFRWGWASYGFLTAMTVLSIGPIRSRFYEWFYISHIITVTGFLVCAMLHHPPLAIWMYIPLAWWFAERLTRALKVAWVNGVGFAGRKPQFALAPKAIYMSGPQQSAAQYSQPVMHDYYAPAPVQNGDAGLPSSFSAYKFPQNNTKSSEYEATLVDSMTEKRYSKLSEPSHMDHAGTSPEDDHPLMPHHSQSPSQVTNAVERRITRLSSRYDLVDELIQEYVPSKESAADEHPRSQSFEMLSQLPSQHTSQNTFKYDHAGLSDARGPSRFPPVSQPGPQYYPSRIAREESNPSALPARPFTAFSTMTDSLPRTLRPRPAMSADVAALIRPGFAFVQLLPGKTLRLTLRTPNKMSWKPGQWVYLLVPGVRLFQSHPFTIASAHDAEFPTSTKYHEVDEETGSAHVEKVKGEERTIVILMRCRKGFTKDLWDHVAKKRVLQIEAAADAQHQANRMGMPGASTVPVLGKDTTGVHLRSIVDGPFGSADRTHWNLHSSVVVICGGSGVSFGISVLEHLCACMSGAAALGKKGKGGRKFSTERVRFVWILREFAHLQWIASALRRCIEMVSPEQLQVELFVTHFNDTSALPAKSSRFEHSMVSKPSAGPTSTDRRDQGNWLPTLEQSHSQNTPMQAARFTEGPEQEEYEITANGLTHFEGEDESAPTAAEEEINKRIRSEGKLRRANTRRSTAFKKGGRNGRRGITDERGDQVSHQPIDEDSTVPFYPQSAAMPLNSGYQDRFGGRGRDEENLRDSSFDLSSGYRRPSMDFQAEYAKTRNNDNVGSSFPDSGGLTVPQSSSNAYFGGLGAYVSPDSSRPGTRRGSAQSTYAHASAGVSSYPPATLSAPYGQVDRQHGYVAPSRVNVADEDPSTPSAHLSTLNLLTSAAPPGSTANVPVENAPIDLNVEEDKDLRVIAELAKPGHPKLDRIIREEVENSQGRTLVAGCGPKSLDIVLRSIVSKQIDPAKVRKGDLRGIVNIVSECFEWGG